MMTTRIGFFGGGAMASAMIAGFVKGGVVKHNHIYVYDPYVASMETLKQKHNINTCSSNAEVLASSDVVIVAVKPNVVAKVLAEVASNVLSRHLIISIAAGYSLKMLSDLLPKQTRLIRVMPNTPATVGESAAAYSLGQHATQSDANLLERLFASLGLIIQVSESNMDAVIGLSGSGPAYVFIMIEALADGGVRAGLSRDVALKLAAQTVKGSAAMVLETKEHPGKLKDQVCSPGGTTIAAVEALEAGGFRASLIKAVMASTNRSNELMSKL